MRIYQVHFTVDAGSSAGYRYFASKREAAKALNEWRRNDPEETASLEPPTPLDITPTRKGILHFLNIYANHADNG